MDELKQHVTRAVSSIPIDFGGGCSVSKGYLMAWLIRQYRLKTSVDIGVYRGRSLVPQAIAHQVCTGGKAYGVDPWLNAEVRETGNPNLRDAIDEFVDATDFPAIYDEVAVLIQKLKLDGHCELVREKSQDAVTYFEREHISFGLIHIDGNHDSERVNTDVSLYLPHLSAGGFVVMDDVSWECVKPACETVSASLFKIFQRVDENNDYAVFWDAPSRISAALLQWRLKSVASG